MTDANRIETTEVGSAAVVTTLFGEHDRSTRQDLTDLGSVTGSTAIAEEGLEPPTRGL